jgi:putative transposase
MSIHFFTTGSQFEWKQTMFTVDRVSFQAGTLRIEEAATGEGQTESLEHLMEAFFAGELRFTLGREGTHRKPIEQDLSDYPPHLAQIARQRYEIVRPLLALNPSERATEVISQRIAEVKAAWRSEANSALPICPVSRRSIYRWLSLLENNNGDVRSLVPHTHLRGAPRKSRLPNSVDALTRQVIQQLYKSREKATLTDLRLEIAARLAEENRLRSAHDQLSLPSNYAILERTRQMNLLDQYALKYGQREARRAVKQYTKTPRPKLPFEVVMLDSTSPDILVLDDQDDLPVGRLTMTYGLDYATTYPAGFYLGFEPASYYTCLETLYHIILPKSEVPQLYGTHHAWKPCGVPSTIVVDNGPEFDNQHLRDACLAIGSELVYAPVETPEFKAGIERFFRTQNEGLLHTLPGTTFSNPHQRGDYDSEGQACLYFKDLLRLIHIYVVDVYAESFHQGIGGIPARRWEAAMQTGFMPRLPASAKDLLILLGRVTYRALHHYGIEFLSLRYNTPQLGQLRFQLKEAARHSQTNADASAMNVKIKYHPGDLSRLYVFNPFAALSESPYIEVPACDPEGYTEHLSLWKHAIICNRVRRTRDKVDYAALGRAKQQIREEIRQLQARKRKTSSKGIARWNGTSPSLTPAQPSHPTATPPPQPPTACAGTEPKASLPSMGPAQTEAWDITFDLPKGCSADFVPEMRAR